MCARAHMYVCVRARASERVRESVCVCVSARVRAGPNISYTVDRALNVSRSAMRITKL